MKGDAVFPAPVPDKGFIPVGLATPKTVVEVGGMEGDILPPGEQVQQAHGIRPAGHGTDHHGAGGEHVVFPDQGVDPLCVGKPRHLNTLRTAAPPR